MVPFTSPPKGKRSFPFPTLKPSLNSPFYSENKITKNPSTPSPSPSPSSSSSMAELSKNVSSSPIGESENNVLQKHVAFFDRNKDGVVYPWETFKGFRAIGANLFLSTVSAVFINVGLSSKTRPGKFPNFLFPIEIKNIQLAKHGSDSGVYDSEGRFVAKKFEEIFKKHALTYPDALTQEELKALLKANREPKDYKGWVAAWTEWTTLYNLCKDENGLLKKETVKAVYDGSLFEHMEKERASKKKK